MNEKKKSEFMLAVETFAQEVAKMTKQDGVKRGIVILASENIDGNENTAHTSAVLGNGGEIVKAIAQFSTDSDTKEFFRNGMKLGALKTLFENIGGGFSKDRKHND